MLNDAQKRDLIDLRAAAEQRNPEQVQFLVKRLLMQMEYYGALAVMLEQVYRFLDIFESYYPDEIWLRTMLVSIAAYGTAPDDVTAEMAMQQSFTAPGAGNYLKAIYDVTQAMQKKHTGEARVGYMTSAMVNTIMAELAEAWYSEREDDWQRVRANQYDAASGQFTDPDAAQIAYTFWMDAQTAALDTAAWLDVADSIEKQLSR